MTIHSAMPLRTFDLREVCDEGALERCCLVVGRLRPDIVEVAEQPWSTLRKSVPWCAGPTTAASPRSRSRTGCKTTDRVARALMAQRHLKTLTVINPVNRCPTVIVSAQEVERFEREYVSLFTLARQQGRHFRKVKQELDAAGVRPAMDPEKIGATFYRRDEVLAVGVLRQD